jgi:SAM-dependent methyltransferase
MQGRQGPGMDETHSPATHPSVGTPRIGATATSGRPVGGKDWDRHVLQADELSRTAGFQDLRDRILAAAGPVQGERALDVGCGTGLLALSLAPTCDGVWAIDNAAAMIDHLRVVVAGQSLENVYPLVASATALPLDDAAVDLVVSNYCYHHLTEAEKHKAIAEAHRVLKPGGRFVFGDMMFGWSPGDDRNREVLWSKVRTLARRGPAGWMRILSNAVRLFSGRGERPAGPEWWRISLLEAGFDGISVEVLAHEGGIAVATKPG